MYVVNVCPKHSEHSLRHFGFSHLMIDEELEITSSFAHLHRCHSVTRLGDLMDFGQLFKAFGNN